MDSVATSTIQLIIAVGTFLALLAGGAIAYGMLKSRVSTLSREKTEDRNDIRALQKEIASFREQAAQTYVSHKYIAVVEERLTRTEERLVGELRHMRETFISAIQDLARKTKD